MTPWDSFSKLSEVAKLSCMFVLDMYDQRLTVDSTLFSFYLFIYVFIYFFKPQNVFPEAANQVLDTPLEEISNTNQNNAGFAMNSRAAADAENADLTNGKNSELSKKKPNETSKMIEPQKDDSEVVDLRGEKNVPEETEPKRQKLSCRICEENEALVAFKPCGHIILCSGI